jgi:sugar lactone lactonase YvrE
VLDTRAESGETPVWSVSGPGDVTVTNGLAFSPDGGAMYRADSTVATGIESSRVQAVEAGRPDGADVDSEGGYWIALLTKGVVARYRPDGTLDFEIAVPVLQPTKVAFGGSDLATLYLTTASYRHTAGDGPRASRQAARSRSRPVFVGSRSRASPSDLHAGRDPWPPTTS